MRRHGWLAVVLATLALAAPAHARVPAGSRSVSAGAVTATLSWSAGDFFAGRPALRIVRAGVVAFDAPLASACRACTSLADPETALSVTDLDGDGEPEILVDTYTGGAHCCTVTPIFRWTGAGYRRLTASFGNVGYSLEDLDHDGRPEFVTADDSFAYAFTAFAFSAFPLRILDYGTDRGGRTALLRDVTSSYPALVAKEAAGLRHDVARRGRGDDARGLIAAYVADLYRLGRRAQAAAYLDSALRRGLLDSPDPGFDIWPARARYVRTLRRFLRSHGYG